MNHFTEAQLRTIRSLAEFYWDEKVVQFVLDYKGRERYIEAIVKGLEDPEVWG